MMQERIQKLLSRAGYGSRRACEEFIIGGRVRVNGEVAILGQKADLSVDKVTLDGKALPLIDASSSAPATWTEEFLHFHRTASIWFSPENQANPPVKRSIHYGRFAQETSNRNSSHCRQKMSSILQRGSRDRIPWHIPRSNRAVRLPAGRQTTTCTVSASRTAVVRAG